MTSSRWMQHGLTAAAAFLWFVFAVAPAYALGAGGA